jgi:tRNA pseudouridine38-40 synthase
LRYCIELAYDGTPFSGWQRQKNANSVQEIIEKAMHTICQEEIRLVGCGRTDAGVHAEQYFAHFDFDSVIPDSFLFRVNQVLPPEIAIKSIEQKRDDFHARFDARSRKYIYKIHQVKNPFLINKSWFIYTGLKLKPMFACCEFLLNTEDFASFCKSGSNQKTTICKLTEARFIELDKGLEFHISADRFLRNMVRAIVGTLVEVGSGKKNVNEFEHIIRKKNRKSAGKSAAACGLYLHSVEY